MASWLTAAALRAEEQQVTAARHVDLHVHRAVDQITGVDVGGKKRPAGEVRRAEAFGEGIHAGANPVRLADAAQNDELARVIGHDRGESRAHALQSFIQLASRRTGGSTPMPFCGLVRISGLCGRAGS
jgi:hypothetical protein